jgi:hypothetical protein
MCARTCVPSALAQPRPAAYASMASNPEAHAGEPSPAARSAPMASQA